MAVIWAIFFAFSLAAGRVISLVVDGRPSLLLIVHLCLEIFGGVLGVAAPLIDGSGNDVGEELILDSGNLVLQEKLLLFEALELECVGAAGFLQCVDGAVQVAMLLLEPRQHRPKLANLLAFHRAPHSFAPLGTANYRVEVGAAQGLAP